MIIKIKKYNNLKIIKLIKMKKIILLIITMFIINLLDAQISNIYELNKEKNIPVHNINKEFSFSLVIVDYDKPESDKCSFTYTQIDSSTGFEIIYNGSFKEAKRLIKVFNKALISENIRNFKLDLGDFRMKIYKIKKRDENALLVLVNSDIAGENYFIITKNDINKI